MFDGGGWVFLFMVVVRFFVYGGGGFFVYGSGLGFLLMVVAVFFV